MNLSEELFRWRKKPSISSPDAAAVFVRPLHLCCSAAFILISSLRLTGGQTQAGEDSIGGFCLVLSIVTLELREEEKGEFWVEEEMNQRK